MKRNILLATIILMLTMFATQTTAQRKQPNKEKSEVEKLILSASRIKSAEIDYAYISTTMFKQILAMFTDNVESVEFNNFKNIVGPVISVRQFQTTGKEGYNKLHTALCSFLQEEEEVMGMELMALSREDGIVSAIYSDAKSLLVISDNNDEELNVVFILGLSYSTLIQMSSDSIDNPLDIFK